MKSSLAVIAGRTAGLACLILLGACARFGDRPTQSTPRLDRIADRGYLTCGMARDVPGFSVFGASGDVTGFDSDLCRAIAVAIFGAPGHARFVPIDTVSEFLSNDRIDIVFHGLTWKFEREIQWDLRFAPVTFHDGLALLVRASTEVRALDGLRGRSVCVQAQTPFESNLTREVASRNLQISVLAIDGLDATRQAVLDGQCAAWAWDASMLLAAMGEKSGEYRILPERLSNEPLAPVLRSGDERFSSVVAWTIYAVIAGEAAGATAMNSAGLPEDHPASRLFRLPASHSLGLSHDWVRSVIETVGNYGEIYERNFTGPDRALHDRGMNRHWRNGGLMYAPPLSSGPHSGVRE